jgi:hypothetical protein
MKDEKLIHGLVYKRVIVQGLKESHLNWTPQWDISTIISPHFLPERLQNSSKFVDLNLPDDASCFMAFP